MGRPTRKLLIPSVESRKRAKTKCRFCYQPNHYITSCPKALQYEILNSKRDSTSRLTICLNNHVRNKSDKVSPGTKMNLPEGNAFLALEELCDNGVVVSCIKSGGTPMEGWMNVVCHVAPVVGWVVQDGKGCVFAKFPISNTYYIN